MAEVVFRYVGEGFLHGVPARDLTQADLLLLDGGQVRAVEGSGLYKRVVSVRADVKKLSKKEVKEFSDER